MRVPTLSGRMIMMMIGKLPHCDGGIINIYIYYSTHPSHAYKNLAYANNTPGVKEGHGTSSSKLRITL
jgi:hypothetical protein